MFDNLESEDYDQSSLFRRSMSMGPGKINMV